jgi:hypothetical protein
MTSNRAVALPNAVEARRQARSGGAVSIPPINGRMSWTQAVAVHPASAMALVVVHDRPGRGRAVPRSVPDIPGGRVTARCDRNPSASLGALYKQAVVDGKGPITFLRPA